MSIDLEAIEARLKAAAPGPWVYVDNGFDGYIMSASEDRIVGGEPAEGRIEPDDPNADFIAHAPEDIKALLAEVERLNAELQSENIQPNPDGKCTEDDGCPTENAVLRREWRKLTAQLVSVTAERDACKADLYTACTQSPCNTGICAAKNCTGNQIPCNFEWRGDRKEQNDG